MAACHLKLVGSLRSQSLFNLGEHLIHIARVKQNGAGGTRADPARHHWDAQRERFAHRNRIAVLEAWGGGTRRKPKSMPGRHRDSRPRAGDTFSSRPASRTRFSASLVARRSPSPGSQTKDGRRLSRARPATSRSKPYSGRKNSTVENRGRCRPIHARTSGSGAVARLSVLRKAGKTSMRPGSRPSERSALSDLRTDTDHLLVKRASEALPASGARKAAFSR